MQALRQAKGLSQAELAQRLTESGGSFQQQTILKVEKGTRPLRFEEANHVAAALGVPMSELLGPSAMAQLLRIRNQKSRLLARKRALVAELAQVEQDIEHTQRLEHEAAESFSETPDLAEVFSWYESGDDPGAKP